MKRSIAVSIAGQRIPLKSDADEAYVRLLAEFVEDKINHLQEQSRQAGLQELAVLTALQIADELFRERRRGAALREGVRERARRLLEQVAELGGQPETKQRTETSS